MIEPGTEIRDYEVWGKIGGGGMSDVWLARHKLLAVPLIVKTLKPSLGVAPAERYERMLNEARLMARVHSDRVVRALDVGIHGDMPYLVQEYIDGIDLNEVDKRRRRAIGLGLPLWYVCEAIARIAEGLHAAHHTGVLHRDIKPSNLFGSPEAGIKLGDFGIALGRSVGDPSARDVCGTLRFMAPEALRGEEVDRRADVFGLGATAFDLRYGFHPFADVQTLLHGSPRPAFPPPVGPDEAYFQHVVARMLAPRVEDRYQSLAEPRRELATLSRSLRPSMRASRQPDGSLLVGKTRIVCEAGDIARAVVDGIVSSSVPELRMTTGVGQALLAAGGAEIELEAVAGGEQPLGSCVVTDAGRLSARRVIHAVSAWREASCVGRTMQRALLAAEEERLFTLAIPALGTGAARVTLESAATAEAHAIRWHLALGGSRLREVRFVLLDEHKLRAFREVIEDTLAGGADRELPEVGLMHGSVDDRVTTDGPTFVTPGVASTARRLNGEAPRVRRGAHGSASRPRANCTQPQTAESQCLPCMHAWFWTHIFGLHTPAQSAAPLAGSQLGVGVVTHT